MTDESKYFSELSSKLRQIDECLAQINSNLEHEGHAPLSKDGEANTLSKYVAKNPKAQGQYSLIEKYIKLSIDINEHVKKHSSGFFENWKIEKQKKEDLFQIELKHGKESRRSERNDMWVLWGHKTVRWVAGAIVAVMLYSLAVYLSEASNFIKVPVKDWFIK